MPPSPVPPRPADRDASRAQPRRDSAPLPAQQLTQEPEQGERVTVGDFLVDSLTAQSLDLPPQAAKVRSSCLLTPSAGHQDSAAGVLCIVWALAPLVTALQTIASR